MSDDLLAYGKLLRAAIAFCAALYELVTGTKAPKSKDVLTPETE